MIKALVKLLANHFGMGDKKEQILEHITMRKSRCMSPNIHSTKMALMSGVSAIVNKVMFEMECGKEYEDGSVHALVREVINDIREEESDDDDVVAAEAVSRLSKIFGAGISIAYSNLFLHIDSFVSLIQNIEGDSVVSITINLPYLDTDIAKVSLSATAHKEQLPAFEFLMKFAEKVANCQLYLTNGMFEEYMPNEINCINIRLFVLAMARSIITIDAVKEMVNSKVAEKFGGNKNIDEEEFMRVATCEIDNAINYLNSEYGVKAQRFISGGPLGSIQYDLRGDGDTEWMDDYERIYEIEEGDYDVDT